MESGSGFVMRKVQEGDWRLDYCEVILSDWFMRAIEEQRSRDNLP